MKKWTKTQWLELAWKIDAEGFDYYFRHYGAPDKSSPFYEEHKKYCEAAKALQNKLYDLGMPEY